MLKKVLKYDLKNIYKLLITFYGLAIFFSILTRIFLNIDNSVIISIIGHICSGTTIALIINILINNIMKLWIRFRVNLYKDESYLTHTLPIEKRTLYLSKFITAIITLLTSIIVITLTLFIAYYEKEVIIEIKNILLPIANILNSNILVLIFVILFIFYLELLNTVQIGYTGLILGHKMNNKKMVYSIIYGFVTYLISQLVALIILFIFAIFNQNIMDLFFTTGIINFETIKTIMYLATGIYVFIIIIIYIINIRELKKGVNVD